MTKPKLFYFDNPFSRGEECRLAFVMAGADFEDCRLSRDQWAALKPKSPFGTMPYLEIEGRATIGQTNAILALVGRLHGLHPTDPYQAAQHEEMMCHVEELREKVGVTVYMEDPTEKKKAREALVAGFLPTWAANAEKHIVGSGPFFAGQKPSVVDAKLHMAVRWFNGGRVDHIPATIFAAYPKLNRVHDAVRDHHAVKAWYAKI